MCESVCMVLCSSRVYFGLTYSVPEIITGSSATLTTIKCVLKMNEWTHQHGCHLKYIINISKGNMPYRNFPNAITYMRCCALLFGSGTNPHLREDSLPHPLEVRACPHRLAVIHHRYIKHVTISFILL